MNSFLIRLFKFSFILLAYIGANYIINIYITSIQDPFPPEVNIVIAGDSHLQKSLNPNEFDSAISIAQTAEPYIATFWKLKYLLRKTKVDTLILGFSHHNISAFNDLKFTDKTWSKEMYERTYLIHNFQSLAPSLYNNTELYTTYFKNMCSYPNLSPFKFIGGYENFDKNKIDDYRKAINRHYYINGINAGVSETSLAYLDSIIDLTTYNNIKLVLTGSPVHKNYFTRIPTYISERYNKEKKRLETMDINIQDFSKTNYPDKYYLNSDHLNIAGSQKFSSELKKSLIITRPPNAKPSIK